MNISDGHFNKFNNSNNNHGNNYYKSNKRGRGRGRGRGFGYWQNYNNNKFNNNNHYQENESRIKNNIETVTKSDEKGFSGPTDEWFSNKEYFDKLPGHSDIEGKKDYYFNSYSSYTIHEQMLKDQVRTGTYKDAIMNNPEAFKDKIVLDIGCGTGILSIFAAKAGAKHVYGLEFADIADYAVEIVKQNKLDDKITIIKSKVEEAKLPVEKVDIIISEWMGYFLLYESMLDTVLYARDKWLKKDGLILPDHATIYLAAVEDINYKSGKKNFWKDVYGVDMSIFNKIILKDPLIETCPRNSVNSSHCKIFEIDLYTVKKEDLEFSSKYELTFWRDYSNFSGVVAWFDTQFKKLKNQYTLSTSPFTKQTHWYQTIFYTTKDIPIQKGDKVCGSIAVRKSRTNFRQLDVKISYHVENGENTKEREENNWYQLYKIA